jgi:hypothetical protein
MAHTALLTDEAKTKLTTVYENIKGRIRTLLSSVVDAPAGTNPGIGSRKGKRRSRKT